MMVPTDVGELRSAGLLVWRSWEQINALESHIARWTNSGGYWFDQHLDDEGILHFTLRFSAVPSEWALLLSEAVHGMRASLDHVVYGLARLQVGRELTDEEARRSEFPIYGREPLTEGLQRRKVGLLGEDLQQMIRRWQPHEHGDDYPNSALWLLSELDNRNKHRVIEPQLVTFHGIMPTFLITEGVSVVLPRSPLHDGLEVFSARPAESSGRRSLIASMRVVFPYEDSLCDGRAGGMEVVHVLRRMHQYVRLIHQQLLRRAGYLYPFPESNAPQEAHDEDENAWSSSTATEGS